MVTMPETVLHATVFVGRTAEGERLIAEIELRQRPKGLELSICGQVFRKHASSAYSFGQNLDTLDDITRPGPGFTLASVARLAQIWRRWHLNALRAGCEHQTRTLAMFGDTFHYPLGEVCPVCSFRYGHAWNYEPLPQDVLDDVKAFAALGR